MAHTAFNRLGFVLALAFPSSAMVATHGPGASFECGGIGQAEQASMKSRAAHHDALLTFAQDTGAYLADVDVRISDRRANVVLLAHCEGPLMLVDLPGAGSYEVTASMRGQTRQRTITVGRETVRAVFTWPAAN